MTNPYVYIVVAEQAAAHGHAGHADDVIGAASEAACPKSDTDPDPDPDPTDDGDDDDDDDDDGEVGGVVIIRPTDDDDDTKPEVIVHTPDHTDPVASPEQVPGHTLAATGTSGPLMIMIAALSLMLGAGLLGFRRLTGSKR
jgi:LPXTG-motif cell wall-anchored protein